MTQLRSEKFAFNSKTFFAIWLRCICIGSSSFLFFYSFYHFLVSLRSVQFSSVQYFYSSIPAFRFVVLFDLSLPLAHIIVHYIRHSEYIRAIRNNKFCFLLHFLSVFVSFRSSYFLRLLIFGLIKYLIWHESGRVWCWCCCKLFSAIFQWEKDWMWKRTKECAGN